MAKHESFSYKLHLTKVWVGLILMIWLLYGQITEILRSYLRSDEVVMFFSSRRFFQKLPNSTMIELFSSFFWKNSRISKSSFEINWPLPSLAKFANFGMIILRKYINHRYFFFALLFKNHFRRVVLACLTACWCIISQKQILNHSFFVHPSPFTY